MKKIARRLRDHPSSRYPIRFSSFEVSNLLATYSVGFPIVLRLLCRLVPNVDYEPERFPAARIKVPMAKAGAEKAANANAVSPEEASPTITTAAPDSTTTSSFIMIALLLLLHVSNSLIVAPA
eukprot:GHVT01017229.1.p5 GENE.GHVT01017229.1~~GHVT01017229.1.p5  ORF type:complete len:123 (-),score=20.23 GHVT01017229.1:1137-1505(-)